MSMSALKEACFSLVSPADSVTGSRLSAGSEGLGSATTLMPSTSSTQQPGTVPGKHTFLQAVRYRVRIQRLVIGSVVRCSLSGSGAAPAGRRRPCPVPSTQFRVPAGALLNPRAGSVFGNPIGRKPGAIGPTCRTQPARSPDASGSLQGPRGPTGPPGRAPDERWPACGVLGVCGAAADDGPARRDLPATAVEVQVRQGEGIGRHAIWEAHENESVPPLTHC